MLFLFIGSDRKKTRDAMNAAIERSKKSATVVVRVSDTNKPEDLAAALGSGGMFAQERLVIFEGVLENDLMRSPLLSSLPAIKASGDAHFILEEKPDAATRKQLEKYAEKSERFDAAKKGDGTTIFDLANALRAGNKKALWVGYQRELLHDAAPEAIHGVLFWAAKDMLLKSRAGIERSRAERLVALLTELPHESRRRGEDLEYALERFVLSSV